MHIVAPEHQLFQACRTLFDLEHDIPREFLEYLQLPGIKSAYRKKALETHPDRATIRGEDIDRNKIEVFHTVKQAYEDLSLYLKAREQGYRLPHRHLAKGRSDSCRPASAARKPRPAEPTTPETEKFYSGPIPERPLLFGHYLYFSGLINWRHIIQALIWQRTARPRLGELARRYGWLNEQQIFTVLKNRKLLKPFGETALELGLLSKAQVNVLVGHQQRLQKKFGHYFIEHQILSADQLQQLTLDHQKHNARFVAGQGTPAATF